MGLGLVNRGDGAELSHFPAAEIPLQYLLCVQERCRGEALYPLFHFLADVYCSTV